MLFAVDDGFDCRLVGAEYGLRGGCGVDVPYVPVETGGVEFRIICAAASLQLVVCHCLTHVWKAWLRVGLGRYSFL